MDATGIAGCALRAHDTKTHQARSSEHFVCATLIRWLESVAQLVEHRPFKALVLGSSPSALTILASTSSSLKNPLRCNRYCL